MVWSCRRDNPFAHVSYVGKIEMEGTEMSDMTVIGMGAMGAAFARTLLAAGRSVTVWNRTPEKMQPLVALGADGASSLGEALAASPRAIVCILNYQQTTELFEQSDIAPLLKDRAMRKIAFEEPRLPTRINKAIPAELETIVLKAMSKSPDELRFLY